MREAGAQAFNKQFPIERVADLTAKAFAKYNVQQVHLWAHAGVVGDAFKSIEQFVMWVNEKWNQGRYVTTRFSSYGDIYSEPSDPGKWVNGIAILIENPEYTKRREQVNAELKSTASEAANVVKVRKVNRKGRSV
jgi:hypothetical protein